MQIEFFVKMKTIALDLGGTRLKLSLVDNEKVIAQTILPAYSENGLLPQLQSIEEAVEFMLEDTMTPITCIPETPNKL